MPYGNYGYRKSKSNMFSSSGTVFQTGSSTYEVRRHVIHRIIEIEPGKAKIIPLLAYHDGEPSSVTVSGSSKVTNQGSKLYTSEGVQEGSLVKSLGFNIVVEPKTQNSSNIIPFHTGRVITSFHDVPGGQVFGLEKDDSNQGKVKFSDEAGSPTLTDVISSDGSSGSISGGPSLGFTWNSYLQGDVIKHW